jgi:hypothetical protein
MVAGIVSTMTNMPADCRIDGSSLSNEAMTNETFERIGNAVTEPGGSVGKPDDGA